MALTAGTRLGPYEILAPLAAGGMSEVYRARHLRLGREVAIKVLPEHLARDPDALGRFEREARAVAVLSHPNILAIHDFGTEQNVSFAVAELLEGETLRSRLAGAPLPWRKALEITVAIAEGLTAAHSKGIVHRDLKPENVFLTLDGQVKILDFGLARWETGRTPHDHETGPLFTEPGTVMGTAAYMSPEQVRGATADPPSDIFALGSILYEMLTGNRAFARETAAETMTAILKEDPAEPFSSGTTVPLEIDPVVRHCLDKNPRERFQSARDLAFALKAILGRSASSVTALGIVPHRSHALTAVASAFVVLVLGVSAYVFVGREKPIDSLAVLPFANAGADPDADYLTDGLTESLINSLSQLPTLRITPRTTVFRYKGLSVDPQTVGRDLKVRAVLTGRVVQRGDSLNVQTDLIDVAKGSQLWGEQYSRKLSDILVLQEEISKDITEKLRLRLSGEERRQLGRRHTEDTEAYQLYLKGRYHWNKRTGEGLRKGIVHFTQAIEKDPGYALAYAGLADCYALLASYGALPPKEGYSRSKAASTKALELDDTLAEAHASLAVALRDYDWDWPASERELKRAIELDPRYASAHHWRAFNLMALGKEREARAEIRRAQELDPLSPPIVSAAGWVAYSARRYDEAMEECRKTIEIDPRYYPARVLLSMIYVQRRMHEEAVAEAKEAVALSSGSPLALAILGWAHAVSGEKDEARKVLAEMTEMSRRTYVSPYWIAVIHAGLGETDLAFRSLELAYEERSNWLIYMAVEPAFDVLRTDPRFGDLSRRVGLR